MAHEGSGRGERDGSVRSGTRAISYGAQRSCTQQTKANMIAAGEAGWRKDVGECEDGVRRTTKCLQTGRVPQPARCQVRALQAQRVSVGDATWFSSARYSGPAKRSAMPLTFPRELFGPKPRPPIFEPTMQEIRARAGTLVRSRNSVPSSAAALGRFACRSKAETDTPALAWLVWLSSVLDLAARRIHTAHRIARRRTHDQSHPAWPLPEAANLPSLTVCDVELAPARTLDVHAAAKFVRGCATPDTPRRKATLHAVRARHTACSSCAILKAAAVLATSQPGAPAACGRTTQCQVGEHGVTACESGPQDVVRTSDRQRCRGSIRKSRVACSCARPGTGVLLDVSRAELPHLSWGSRAVSAP